LIADMQPYRTLSFKVSGRIGLVTLRQAHRRTCLGEELAADLRRLVGQPERRSESAPTGAIGSSKRIPNQSFRPDARTLWKWRRPRKPFSLRQTPDSKRFTTWRGTQPLRVDR
jgi:hypothetical protein